MSAKTTEVRRPRVYISYRWGTPKLERKGRWLADKLRDSGIDSRIDLYYGKSLHGFTPPPPSPNRKAWDYWQEQQIKLADRIIVFCTDEYALAPPDSGVARDLRYIESELQKSHDNWEKLIPVGLGTYEANAGFIPAFMRDATYYDIGSPQRGMFGLADLIRRLKTEFPTPGTTSPEAEPVEESSAPVKRKGKKTVSKSTLQAIDLKGKVHAAIITIRHDEYEAMESRLGKVQTVVGNNTYKYAELTPHEGDPISVVLTRVVGQGNTRAQAVASNIINELDPAWLILVGIAGGVPDTEYSLGDVVLATYLHDFSLTAATDDGVTRQHMGGDMHREVERFLSTRAVGTDGNRLRKLAGFDSDPELVNHPVVYSEDIQDSERYYGPDAYRAKVKRTIALRFPDGKRKGGPLVRQGPCANGNVLVKSANLLKTWQESARHIVQVEMELGGVYEAARTLGRENYPVLAIRGLSDIVGFARDGNWTGYACKTAAAFTFAVLESGFVHFAKNLPNLPDKDSSPLNPSPPNSRKPARGGVAGRKTSTATDLGGGGKVARSSAALALWQKKLDFLQTEEAKAADAEQKFLLQQRIEEAQEKIRQLGG
jgi:nucleoside phosphorylase